MTNKPNMAGYHFRAPADLLDAARAKAAERQENLSDVLRAALLDYISND